MPAGQVARIASELPDAEVIDGRAESSRRAAIADADILFSTRITSDEFRSAPRLRWIHTSAVGVDGLLVEGVAGSRVVITNARGVHADAIAEHAVALVLALRRGLHVASARQAAGVWAQVELSRRVVRRLRGASLVVVGLGQIGSRVAAMAAGLGMSVTGVRRHLATPAPPGVERVLSAGQLHEALPTADAVVLAVPRTGETSALFGASEIALLPASAVIVNVARGGLIDEGALAGALRSGRLAGAGLDAFAEEPLPPASPWWTMPNTLVTPHTAAFDGDYWTPVVDLFLENVARFRRGEPLRNVIDPQRGY
jgi:phosphoglycerate dehydrogenase-like enzyme